MRYFIIITIIITLTIILTSCGKRGQLEPSTPDSFPLSYPNPLVNP